MTKEILSGIRLKDRELKLVFVGTKPVTEPDISIDAYHFKMRHADSGENMGEINIKAGYTENIIRYRGNIGFTVYEPYRGHYYSGRSCKLLIPVIRLLDLKPVFFTCSDYNHGSRKNIESTGADYIETVVIADDCPYTCYYPEKDRIKLRYRWEVDVDDGK